MIGSALPARAASPAFPSPRLCLTALAAALALAACGGGDKPAPASAPATAAQPAAAAPAPAPAPEPVVPELTVPELLKAASLSVNEQRLIIPAGNNAMEYYLAVLAKEPNNIQATQALVDIFPISVNVTERAIAQKQIDEADRMVKLLDKASPNSYTVTTVRAKLETARAAQTKEQATLLAQQQQQQTAQQQAAAQKAAETQAAAAAAKTAQTPAQTPAPAPAQAPAPAPSQPVASAAPPPTQTAPPPPAAPEPAAPTGESRQPSVVRQVPPDFPPDAYRKRIEGWVELEFTVGADGKVADVTVSKAQPQRVFDREAIRAMQQWTFQPALKDGKPVETKLKRRMEFKM